MRINSWTVLLPGNCGKYSGTPLAIVEVGATAGTSAGICLQGVPADKAANVVELLISHNDAFISGSKN